jgi:hypothetical protein
LLLVRIQYPNKWLGRNEKFCGIGCASVQTLPQSNLAEVITGDACHVDALNVEPNDITGNCPKLRRFQSVHNVTREAPREEVWLSSRYEDEPKGTAVRRPLWFAPRIAGVHML